MIRLKRKSKLNGRSPMQKLLRGSSKESLTEPSSSMNLSDDDLGEFLNESPRSLVQARSDSIYTDDQVVITPEDTERPKVALHASFGDESERSSTDFDLPSTKKKKKKKTKSRQVEGKSKKSSPKTTPTKTKKKQRAQKQEDSPFWSLSPTMSPTAMNNRDSRAADNLEDSMGFDESFASHDSSVLLPSKASMEAKGERTSLSPSGGRRNQRASLSAANGTVLMPSKASLERSESVKSTKSTKKKRRPRASSDASSSTSLSPNMSKSPDGRQDKGDVAAELAHFLANGASDEFRPSTGSVSSRSQSSRGSQKSKGKKTSDGRSKKSKSVSPKRNVASLPPAIEGKQSSFSSLHFHSFGDSQQLALGSQSEPFSLSQEEEEDSTKIKQPSKASLESMLERVKIRKKTRKGSSSASVGSARRGKRPQVSIDSSEHSVVSLDTGMIKSMNKAVRQDSLSGEQTAAMSAGTRKKNPRPLPVRTLPRRATSYQSNSKADGSSSPTSTQPSKASVQKNLEKRDSVKNRKLVGSRRTALSPERSSAPASIMSSPPGSSPKSILKTNRRTELSTERSSAPASIMSSPSGCSPRSILKTNRRTQLSAERSSAPASIMKSPPGPKSIMKTKRRSSFGNDSSAPVEQINEEKFVVQRRASFNGSSKHPLVHALSGYDGENSNEDTASVTKRRGTRSPSAKGRMPESRNPSTTIKPDLADDPWDSIDEAFMPISSAKAEEKAENLQGSNDMWTSLARLGEGSSSGANFDASTPSSKRQQQLKATEFMDAWWNVQDDDGASVAEASRKKKLAQKSMLLVSSGSIRSIKSSEFSVDEQTKQDNTLSRPQSKSPSGRPGSRSPPPCTVAKTTMHVSMPMPSLDSGSSHKPALKSTSAHSPLSRKQRQPKPKQSEVTDAWWAEDVDDAKETKKKQLARKSVLLVGHSSMTFGDDFDYDDDEGEGEEIVKHKVVMDPRSGRRVVQYPGGRRPASPGRASVNRRKMQPVVKNKKALPFPHDVMGSPQEQQQKKVAAAFKF